MAAKLLLPSLALLLLLLPSSAAAVRRLSPSQHYRRFLDVAALRRRTQGRVLKVTAFGGDPTGNTDSSAAITKAVAAAFTVQQGKTMLQGVGDLGGVVVDLQGGDYSLSSPIVFPSSGGGNVVIQGGTIRAAAGFPGDGFLVELAGVKPPAGGPGIVFEDVTFRDVLFDSSLLGGGLHVADSARIRIDNCYFVGFATAGILVERGHEAFISDTFLGQLETVGGDHRERNFTGTAIELASNDNAVTDVAIFSAAVGVLLRGQANILTRVHCYNKATFFGGVGVHVAIPGWSQTRIAGCYMDYTSIVVEDPVQLTVVDTFFLGDGNVVLRAKNGVVTGVTIVNNIFSGSAGTTPIVQLDESTAPFGAVEQVVVKNNVVYQMVGKTTAVSKAVAGAGSRWEVSFVDELLFPGRIDHVEYSLFARNATAAGLPAHAVTAVAGGTVVVEAAAAVDAVVTVAVDQNLAHGEKSLYVH